MSKKSQLMVVMVVMIVVLISSTLGTVSFAASAYEEFFDYYNTSKWEKADGYSNGSMFNCTWRANNVNFYNGQMELKITSPSYNVFDGGEYRSRDFYGYGLYEVRMKPAKNIGIVSSFFTYTGPSDGKPWDEIDIEFLGKDTTKMQCNYFTNGTGGHEYLVNLGFDASQAFHTYGFEWQPGYIKWYVDGVLKYTATSNIPSNPGKIMMNLWNGKGVDSWLGAYDGTNPIYAYYDNVKYTPISQPSSSYVRIRNAATGLYLDGMGYTTNGSNACQWGDSNSNAQQWTIENSGSYVLIKNRQTGLYLDGMGRTGYGDICGQWSYSNSNNQQWTKETVGSNVRFKNRQTGLYLDGMGSTGNGSNLCQWGSGGSYNQQWQIQ